jgi:hypothetical protein
MNNIDQLETQITCRTDLHNKMRNQIERHLKMDNFTQAIEVTYLLKDGTTHLNKLISEYDTAVSKASELCFEIVCPEGEALKTFTCNPWLSACITEANKHYYKDAGLFSGTTLTELEVGQPKAMADILGFPTGYTLNRLA